MPDKHFLRIFSIISRGGYGIEIIMLAHILKFTPPTGPGKENRSCITKSAIMSQHRDRGLRQCDEMAGVPDAHRHVNSS